ncbi:MAG: C40 family peptidase [Holophagales bacterium]|nr:C40 family peptidase [Holophagales bacterium]
MSMTAAGCGAERVDSIPETCDSRPEPLALGDLPRRGGGPGSPRGRALPPGEGEGVRRGSLPLWGSLALGVRLLGVRAFRLPGYRCRAEPLLAIDGDPGGQGGAWGDPARGPPLLPDPRKRISHVGIYLGEGLFIHAGSRGGPGQRGVKVARLDSAYYDRRLVQARRVVPRDGPEARPEEPTIQTAPGADATGEVGPTQ